jgi:Leucine-rich repeat (LRR) protein
VIADISHNNLTGTIPSFDKATNLVQLFLDDNFFNGFEEDMYLNAPNLQEFSVANNSLEGRIPEALTNLSNLTLLNMSHNRLSGDIPSKWSNSTPFSIDLSQNQLSGSIPASLITQVIPGDQSINVSYNLLNGSIPVPTDMGLYSFSLMTLDFSHNQLRGPIPWQILTYGSLYLGNNLLWRCCPCAY